MAIRFNVPYLGGNELKYLAEVIENRVFAGNGPFTERVQQWMESRYGVPRVLLTHSCTGALEMIPMLYGWGPGDEVIIPSYTFSSTASAFVRAGCKVVFCDVDPETMMLDPEDVAKRITKKTKAIIPVHYAGVAADMAALQRVGKDHGVLVIEDAAQGLEAKLDGRALGTFGPLGTMSFHETKNIHAGLSGALYINDAALADRAVYIWERGTNRQEVLRGVVDKYSWVEVGGSFYPSEMQAAFLMAQLETVDRNIAERKPLWERYRTRMQPLHDAGKLAMQRIDADRTLNYHAFFVVFPSFAVCERVREHLKAKGIAAYIGYVPLHTSKVGRALGGKDGDLPITEEYATRVLRFPLHNEMSVADVDAVCDAVTEVA